MRNTDLATMFSAILAIAATAACDDDGSMCPDDGACDRSPVGSWELDDCAGGPTLLTYTELVMANGQTTTHTCSIELSRSAIVTTGHLEIVAGGTYTRSATRTGAWHGVADPQCLSDFGVTCAGVVGVTPFGATACVETDGRCICDGEDARSVDESGTWHMDGAQLVLDDQLSEGERSFGVCANDRRLRLDLGSGADSWRYDRVAAGASATAAP